MAVTHHSREHLQEVIEAVRQKIEASTPESELAFAMRDFDWIAGLAEWAMEIRALSEELGEVVVDFRNLILEGSKGLG